MALPKLNDMPKYSVTIPSLNKEIRIRPFVVKEEKVLLIAMESQDPKQIASAILDTIVSCSDTPIETKRLTAYDVEYIFMQIRARSVGESADVRLKCQSCDEASQVKINIDDIKINNKIPEPKIKLSDSITIMMKQPSYMQIANNEKILGEDVTLMDRLFSLVIECVDCVMTNDERISFKDVTVEEATEFLESMTSDQFTKIREFMEQQPTLKHDVKFACEHCGANNKVTLEGLQDFF